MSGFEKIFASDVLSKRERVIRALEHKSVDRVPILEQLSYNPQVISLYLGREIQGFDYTMDDIGKVIRKTLDICMPPIQPRGTERITTPDGFVHQNDNWTSWRVSQPFEDEIGAREWLLQKTQKMLQAPFNAQEAKKAYRQHMQDMQKRVGDTVLLNYSSTGFCSVYDAMRLDLFTYFMADYPQVMTEYMEASTNREIMRVHAIADAELSPVILIPEDFAAKHGPIFGPAFLQAFHYPYVEKLVQAWHSHGIKVIYHSDGNYEMAINDLVHCGVDGFYCLEANCSMDIVALKKKWPNMVFAGGVDGVDLMERGTPQEVAAEVKRQIRETDALRRGGIFIASSSEINPPIMPQNFQAMIDAVGTMKNDQFQLNDEGR